MRTMLLVRQGTRKSGDDPSLLGIGVVSEGTQYPLPGGEDRHAGHGGAAP